MAYTHFKTFAYAFSGGVIWTVHFLLIYAIGEFGCLSNVGWVFESVVALTVLLLILTLFALIKCYNILSSNQGPLDQTVLYLARYGVVSNAVFAFIILYQSIPIFYFRSECL